jgi:hypothetical protein
MKFFKEIKEAYNKRDAYQRDYDSSVAGMGKRQSYAYQQDGGANDEGWDQPERSYQAPEYTYYIRFKDSGTVYKQKGAPKSFSNKAGANAYALAMIKNNPSLKGNLLLTVDAEDKPTESQVQEATVEPDDGAPYMIYTDVVQAGQFAAKTLKGAKNAGRHAVMQQQAHTYAIVTDINNEIVFVWYPTDQENKYQVGNTYRPPSSSNAWQGTDQPRYPEGHPYAGAVMPPNIPITTDWHAQEQRPKQESVRESAEDLPMYGAIIHRIMVAHPDLLAKYGPEKIMSAAEDEAEWVGDVEEIGSSDVSISVKRVMQALQEQHGVAEGVDNPTDVINVDVPMLIRVLEFAREDAQSDVDLHKVAERLIELSADGRTVTMDDYNAVVSELKTNVEEADMTTGNQGYDNMLAVMKAVDAGQDATFNLAGEPITLEYPEARFLAGKYKAFLKAGRQEEFLKYMDDPVMFDRLMKQLRDLIDKQKNFRGSVPGERGVEEGVVDTLKAGAKKALKAITGPDDEELIQRLEKETGGKRPEKKESLPKVAEGYYYCKITKSAKLIPEGYKKTADGYITRK